jgi:hypothetical protein
MQTQNEAAVKISSEFLTALATATTKYYEAPPDGREEARVQYELALTRFNSAQSTPMAGAVPAGTRGDVSGS